MYNDRGVSAWKAAGGTNVNFSQAQALFLICKQAPRTEFRVPVQLLDYVKNDRQEGEYLQLRSFILACQAVVETLRTSPSPCKKFMHARDLVKILVHLERWFYSIACIPAGKCTLHLVTRLNHDQIIPL